MQPLSVWVNDSTAIITGWRWWLPPIIAIAILFIGLFSIAVGRDEIANPRVRNRV